jgi:hypothetical protein
MTRRREVTAMPSDSVGARYDALPANLRLWLNAFRNEWLTAATRSPTAEDGVPHVTKADGRHGVLQRALSMRATTADHRYRRYLTVDRNLSHFEEVDMPTVEEILHSRATANVSDQYDDSKADLVRKVLEDVPRTTMERLLDESTPAAVADRVVKLSEDFAQVSDEGMSEPDDWDPARNEWDYYTSHSDLARTQRANIAASLDGVLKDHPDGARALDPRIANLVFADLDTADDVLPVVDTAIKPAIAALAEESIATVTALGFELPVDRETGQITNEFKRPYQGNRTFEASTHPNGAGEGTPTDGEPLFTDAATLDNVGDPDHSFEEFVNYSPGEDTLYEFVPLYAKYRARKIEGTDYRWDYHPVWPPGALDGIAGIDRDDGNWYDTLGVELKYVETVAGEHVGAYQKLQALHRTGTRWGQDAGVLSSLLVHLLRFGRLRNAVTNYASDAIHGYGEGYLQSPDDPLGVLFGAIDKEQEYGDVEFHHNATGSDTLVDQGGYNSLFTDPDEGFDIHPHRRTQNDNLPINVALGTAGLTNVGGGGTFHPFRPSLRHLHTVDEAALEWLTTSTLELSSHRFDAWWTSIAARRLAELRGRAGKWHDPTTGNLPAGTRSPTLEPRTRPDSTGEERDDDSDGDADEGAPRRPPGFFDLETARRFATADYEDLTGPVSGGDVGRTEKTGGYGSAGGVSAGRMPGADPTRGAVRGGAAGAPGPGDDVRFMSAEASGYEGLDSTAEYVSYDDVAGVDRAAATPAAETWVTRRPESRVAATGVDTDAATGDASTVTDRVGDDVAESDADDAGSGIYVGAWGFLENLEPDPDGQDHGEYIQAPSVQQATTAAILRGGNQAYEAEDEGHLSSVDLSADRVRLAQTILDGVRDGQALSALLGYRFERALQDRDLQAYVLAYREAFPGTTENRNRDEGQSATLGVKYDVVDGYALYQLLDYDTDQEGVDVAPSYPDHLPDPDVDPAVEEALVTLVDAVDAVRDLLTAESVHQFAQGNATRAKVSLDTVAADGLVPDLDVVDTPRTETSITHRLSVTFGDLDATTPAAWSFDNRLDHPPVKAVGSGDDAAPGVPAPADDGYANGHQLQVRADAEPNLDAWLGETLPSPADVGCSATFEWTDSRQFAAGSFTTPTEPGHLSVSDVGFRPDVVLLTASSAVGDLDRRGSGQSAATGNGQRAGAGTANADGSESPSDRATYGWTHGAACRQHDDTPQQHAVSVGYDAGGDTATSAVATDRAFDVVLEGSGGSAPTTRVRGEVLEMTSEGFEVDVGLTAGDAAAPVVVEYLALETGDLSSVEIGHLASPAAAGSRSETLSVDADHVLLTATDGVDAATLSAGGATTGTTTGAVGISHGEAVSDGSSIDQRAVSVEHAPGATATPTLEADDGTAVSLPGGAASVTGLGTSLDLSFDGGDGTAHPVTYVAIEHAEGAPTPELGVASAGENVLDGGFEPAAVEFVAVPGVTEADFTGRTATTTAGSGTAGIGVGVSAGVAGQRALSHAVGPGSSDDATATLDRAGASGHVVSLSTTAADGTETTVRARATALTEDGFTLEFPEGEPDDLLVLYRAWPAVPTEREHAPSTTATLDELLVTPLDVLYGAQADRDGALTELERRLGYYLLRARESKVAGTPGVDRPPIPADATVDLTLRDAGGAPLSAADFLEVVRAFRDVIAEGRAATAEDFVHPAERAGTGYDHGTYSTLHARAGPLQDAMADVTALLENRIEAFDAEVGDDGAERPALTEQVDRIQDALATFRSSVPLPGVKTAVDGVVTTATADPTALEDELAALAAALPAGPTSAAGSTAAFQVEALAGRTVRGRTSAPEGEPLRLELTGYGRGDQIASDGTPSPFERTVSGVAAGADGRFEADIDFHDADPGTHVTLTALDGSGDVVYSADGRVIAPESGVEFDAAPGQTVSGTVDATGETALTVTVESDADDASGLTSVTESVSVTTDATGAFTATVDLSSTDPGTPIAVSVTDDAGDEVLTLHGFVRRPRDQRDPAAVVESGVLLRRLLWLARERDDLDPGVRGSAAADLQESLSAAETEWQAITRETTLIDAWRTTAANGAIPARGRPVEPAIDRADVDDLSVLTTLAKPATHDLGPLVAAIEDLLALPDAAGVTDAIDLTGGRHRPDDVRAWATGSDDRLAAVRGQLSQLLRNPAGRTFDLAGGFAPEFVAFCYSGAPTLGGHVERFLAYLDAVFADAGEVIDDLRGDLDRPDRTLAGLRDAAVYPARFVDGTDVSPSTLSSHLADLVGYYEGPGLDALDEMETAVKAARRTATAEGVTTRNLDQLLTAIDAMRGHWRETPLKQGLEAILKEVKNFRNNEGRTLPAAVEDVNRAYEALADELAESEPWTDVTALDRLLADVGTEPYLTTDGSPGGTPATEFVYLLSELQTALGTYEQWLDSSSPPGPVYQASRARSDYDADRDSWVATLDGERSTLETYVDVDRSTRLNEAFRRCLLETVRLPLLRAAYFGVFGSTPTSATGGSPGDESALLGQAQGVAERLKDRLSRAETARTAAASHAAAGDYGPAAERELERIEALFGDDFVVLPPLAPPNQAEVSKTFERTHQEELLSAADPMEVETWFQRQARVRDRPAGFREALSYAEMVSGDVLRSDLRVGQLPYRNSDNWAGIDAQDGTPSPPDDGTVSLVTYVASTHAGQAKPVASAASDDQNQTAGRFAALYVDDWRVAIPSDEETTGVAVNYDDPGMEPPQSILLAVPPAEDDREGSTAPSSMLAAGEDTPGTGSAQPWTDETLVRSVLEATDLLKMRAVDLDALGSGAGSGEAAVTALGHLLPGLVFPYNTKHRPDVPSVKFSLDEDIVAYRNAQARRLLSAELDLPVASTVVADSASNGSGGDDDE